MKTFIRHFALFAVFAFSVGARADFALPAQPTARVNDYAHVLTQTASAGLEQKFASFEQRTGHQAFVAIFPTIDDNTIEDIATRLFEKWGVGKKKENDGVLLVLSMKEHAVRIEVGYGLEGNLPDAFSGRIIRQDMVPYLKDGQVATAILVYEKRLEDIFLDSEGKPRPAHGKGSPVLIYIVIAFILLGFFFRFVMAASYARTITSDGIYRRRRSSFWDTWWWGGGGWGGGGGFGGGGSWGGGGGGFGGGGGGMSGGGGASGNW